MKTQYIDRRSNRQDPTIYFYGFICQMWWNYLFHAAKFLKNFFRKIKHFYWDFILTPWILNYFYRETVVTEAVQKSTNHVCRWQKFGKACTWFDIISLTCEILHSFELPCYFTCRNINLVWVLFILGTWRVSRFKNEFWNFDYAN